MREYNVPQVPKPLGLEPCYRCDILIGGKSDVVTSLLYHGWGSPVGLTRFLGSHVGCLLGQPC